MKFLILALLTFNVFAADFNLLPGEATSVTLSVPDSVISVPVPGTVQTKTVACASATCPPVVLPPPLNAHAEIHPAEAKLNGYDYCASCHTIGGGSKGNAKSVGKGICSQAQFCGQPSSVPGGKSCTTGVVVPNAAGTGPLIESVSGKTLVTGGYTAYYVPGQEVRCSDCHNMKVQSGNREWSKNQIHVGCLDCHTAVGSESLKPGVKK